MAIAAPGSEKQISDRKVSSSLSSKKKKKNRKIKAAFDVLVSQLTFPKDQNLQKFLEIFFIIWVSLVNLGF